MEIKFFETKLKQLGSIETNRLVLRNFKEDDAEDMFLYASDDKVTENLTWVPYNSVNECKGFIKGFFANKINEYAIVLKDENKVIGSISLRLIPTDNKGEVGYVLNRNYWNKGYMTEALGKIIEISFEHIGLNKIECIYINKNNASGKVMEKSNMVYEGTLQQSKFIKGKYVDCVYYGITKDKYFSLNKGKV